MDLTMFANFNAHKISLREAKSLLNRNGIAYSDEEVAKIVDFLYDFAGLSVEHLENQNRESVDGFNKFQI